MKTIFLILLFGITASGGEPSIVFDNRPEDGIPPEARAQERERSQNHGVVPVNPGTLSELLGDSIKSVRVRYFSKGWTNEKQVGEYLAGLFTAKSIDLYTYQIWSQGVGQPEIECLIDFTDDYRHKLFAEHKQYHEGRLLLWETVCCFRDATGQWWFVNVFHYFHSHHPSGNRELSREKKGK